MQELLEYVDELGKDGKALLEKLDEVCRPDTILHVAADVDTNARESVLQLDDGHGGLVKDLDGTFLGQVPCQEGSLQSSQRQGRPVPEDDQVKITEK